MPELPESMREGRAEPEAAERALVRKPQIGDTRPAPVTDSARRRRRETDGDASRTSRRRQDAAAARRGKAAGASADRRSTPSRRRGDASGAAAVATPPRRTPDAGDAELDGRARAGASATAARSAAT